MTAVVPPVVAAARGLVDPVLREAVARLDPMTAGVAAYHFGWTSQGRPAGGKALRPALAFLSARAAGGSDEECGPAAAAVELVHAFSLLHDDIMDGDRMRRHRPAAWTVFGRSEAILAGDALLGLAAELLVERGSPGHLAAAHALSRAVRGLIAGQALDLEFERRDDVTLGECLRMATRKTGDLLACACSIGAMAAGAPPALVSALAAFGTETGLAFQLADDLLGIWGDPQVTGKAVLSDLRARKKSLPVVAALTSGTEAGDRLAELLARPGPLPEDVLREAAALVDQAGGRTWAEQEAKHRLDAAGRHLADADMPPGVRAQFLDIAGFITSRDH
ncbi:polyprenyl synthetase family protein [Sphaerisporangium fuscum]|uniref:polyprenyl synthetase family protein n=1 Tax=Sphaerisporangium fuscum TaxID=2835868 RepID=UPI001BDBF31A|nr:polyprenyl synthetase family protein [Sphaerisporangium fuscum]